jgi:hypothetical protein
MPEHEVNHAIFLDGDRKFTGTESPIAEADLFIWARTFFLKFLGMMTVAAIILILSISYVGPFYLIASFAGMVLGAFGGFVLLRRITKLRIEAVRELTEEHRKRMHDLDKRRAGK